MGRRVSITPVRPPPQLRKREGGGRLPAGSSRSTGPSAFQDERAGVPGRAAGPSRTSTPGAGTCHTGCRHLPHRVPAPATLVLHYRRSCRSDARSRGALGPGVPAQHRQAGCRHLPRRVPAPATPSAGTWPAGCRPPLGSLPSTSTLVADRWHAPGPQVRVPAPLPHPLPAQHQRAPYPQGASQVPITHPPLRVTGAMGADHLRARCRHRAGRLPAPGREVAGTGQAGWGLPVGQVPAGGGPPVVLRRSRAGLPRSSSSTGAQAQSPAICTQCRRI